jgi:CRISPR system Cascade subunit CasB
MSAVNAETSSQQGGHPKGPVAGRVWAGLAEVLKLVTSDNVVAASLRRGVGRPLEECPSSWRYVFLAAGASSNPRRLEAVHHAIALCAWHQQSASTSMHTSQRVSVGAASRMLATQGPSSGQAVERRFTALVSSSSMESLVVHLRQLISLLRGANLPLNYEQLARDLANWEDVERGPRVRFHWARDFFIDSTETEGQAVQ